MPLPFTDNTFKGTYKDDFLDSSGYHRILFNSGRPLQARELTQLQTILQTQITRFAKNIFLDGAAVNPKSSGAGTSLASYVVVERIDDPNNKNLPDQISDYIGAVIRGSNRGDGNNGMLFQISEVRPSAGDNLWPVFYGRYVTGAASDGGSPVANSDTQATTQTFAEGETLTRVDGGPALVDLKVRTRSGSASTDPAAATYQPPSTGTGVLFNMQGTDFFSGGYFVYAPPQQAVIEPYTKFANCEVGFEIIQDVVTVLDDEALYDNQGARPNLSSPGADRFRIRLELKTKKEVANELDYLSFAIVRNSKIMQIKSGTDHFNAVEARLATRQDETTGNFIVNKFDLRISEKDSSDGTVNKLEYHLPVGQLGVNPLAYFQGYRLEQELDQFRTVKKPLSTTVDSDHDFAVNYGNYVSVKGAPGTSADSCLGKYNAPNLNLQRKHILWDSNGDNIGDARIKHVFFTDISDSDTYRLHLYDISMKENKNFRNVERISNWGDAYAGAVELALEDDQLYIQEAGEHTSLFEISPFRVKEVADVTFTVQRYASEAVQAGNVIQVTKNSGESFVDEGRWVFINTTQNIQVDIPFTNFTESGNQMEIDMNASIDAAFQSSVGNNIAVYYYVQKGATGGGVTHRTKAYTEQWFTATRNRTDSAGDSFYLSHSHADSANGARTAIDHEYDGYELVSAFAFASKTPSAKAGAANLTPIPAAEKTVITNQLQFDGGQRDNYYGPIKLFPAGLSSNIDSVRVKVAYFEHGVGGHYFGPNSYDVTSDPTVFDYGNIPTYVSQNSGILHAMHNYFDFRPKLNPGALQMNTSDWFEMPRDGDQINCKVTYYNQRIDQIALTYNKDTYRPQIVVNKGTESLSPLFPNPKEQEMILFSVLLGGNTKDVSDLMISTNRYPRYTMGDIDRLRNRVGRLEETVALSFIEQEAQNLIELDANGFVRSKTGFFVDDFTKGMALTASSVSPNFIDDDSFITQTLDEERSLIQPCHEKRWIDFEWDSTNKYGTGTGGYSRVNTSTANHNNIRRVGDLLMLDYVDTLDSTMRQEMISWRTPYSYEERGYYNVNPFNVFQGEGRLSLNPTGDAWVDNVRLPDRPLTGGTVHVKVNDLSNYTPRSWTATFTRSRVFRGELTGRVRETFSHPPGHPDRRLQMREREWTQMRETSIVTANVTERVRTRVIDDSFKTTINDAIISVDTVPFIRQKRVLGKAEGLRPDTRYWLYFDNVRMDQWVLDLGSQGSYTALINAGAHRKTYPSVNVTYKKHPHGTGAANENVLISDEQGRIWFDMFIPNNAIIPVPKSTVFPFAKELATWVAKVKKATQLYGAKNPQVYDYAGWKFEVGTKPVKLLDISANNNEDALSLAKTTYTATGTQITRRRDLITARVITSEDYITLSEEVVSEEVTDTVQIGTTWQRYDPLAQTFMLVADEGVRGAFITKVEIFLRRAPTGDQPKVPLQIQIRNVRDGTPVRDAISDQHRKYISADSCNTVVNAIKAGGGLEDLDTVLANPVSCTFEEPLFIEAGAEYAIVLLSECDNYEAFVGTTYDLILGRTDKRVNKQPALGSLFLSQNGSTWTPKQNQDLAYRIYTAKFKENGKTNVYSQDHWKAQHNYNTSIIAVDEDSATSKTFRVLHQAHCLGVGDKIQLTGLIDSSDYFGVLGSVIMNSNNVVASADVFGYEVKLPAGEAFTSFGAFGADSVSSATALNIDRFTWEVTDTNFTGTSTKYEGSFVSGYNHAQIGLTSGGAVGDPRYDIDDVTTDGTNANGNIDLAPYTIKYFSNPRYLPNSDQASAIGLPAETHNGIVVQCAFETLQKSAYGNVTAAQKSSGYVSDVSPVIDLQTLGAELINYTIDNQPYDSVNTAGITNPNTPVGYTPETHPILGTSPSKHITRVVTLPEPGTGLKVVLKAHKPIPASIDLYYRTATGSDQDIYTVPWIRVNSQNQPRSDIYVPNDAEVGFQEYDYLIGGQDGDLPEFRSFQVKAVMRSTNSCQVPLLKDIKVIALI